MKIAQNEEEYGQKVENTKKEFAKIKAETRKMVLKIA